MKEENMDKSEENIKWRYLIFSHTITILFIVQIALCFFFYNWAGLNLVLYTGWILLFTGIIIFWKSQADFRVAGKKLEKNWLDTSNVVDSGIYSVVRHPMYLAFILIAVALFLISQYWLTVVLGIIRIILFYDVIRQEEKGDLDKFGDDYKEYMQNVPRLNIIAGIIRLYKKK